MLTAWLICVMTFLASNDVLVVCTTRLLFRSDDRVKRETICNVVFLNYTIILVTYLVSKTSILLHTVAQPTKWRLLPKKLSQLVIFEIQLAFTWSWVDKNHHNLISFIILIFVSVEIIGLGEQFIIKPFFDKFIFWISPFSEIGPYFYRLVIKWTLSEKLF